MGSGRPPVWILIRAHLCGDPKKTAVLVLLAVVMAVVYARLFFTTGGPQEAVAADRAVAASPPAAAAELVLESTIVGPAPLASIGGRVVRPGDEIDGFVLERVEPTRVMRRRHEIRVILPLG